MLGSGLLEACVIVCASRRFLLVWGSLSCRYLGGVSGGGWLWVPQVRVTRTAAGKRPVLLTSHKIYAFYLVQLVIFINHMDPVAMQMNTQSEMTRKSEPKACVPVLRASGPCEWPLPGTVS